MYSERAGAKLMKKRGRRILHQDARKRPVFAPDLMLPPQRHLERLRSGGKVRNFGQLDSEREVNLIYIGQAEDSL